MNEQTNFLPRIDFIGGPDATFKAETGRYEEGPLTAQQEIDIDEQIASRDYARDINEHALVPVRDYDGSIRQGVTPESLKIAAEEFVAGGSQDLPKRIAEESIDEFKEARLGRVKAGKAVLAAMGSLEKIDMPPSLAADSVASRERRKITSTRERASRLHASDVSRRYGDRTDGARRQQIEVEDA